MAVSKQQDLWEDESIKITMPPPAYSHQSSPPLFPSQPPPCYDHYGDVTKVDSSLEEEDSWSLIMHRPFYQRWRYLLRSWGQVLQQGKWAILAFLFPLFFVFILIAFILPSQH